MSNTGSNGLNRIGTVALILALVAVVGSSVVVAAALSPSTNDYGASGYEPEIDRADADIVVDADGSGDYTNFSHGLTNATENDSVWVAKGDYRNGMAGDTPVESPIEAQNVSVYSDGAVTDNIVIFHANHTDSEPDGGYIAGVTWDRSDINWGGPTVVIQSDGFEANHTTHHGGGGVGFSPNSDTYTVQNVRLYGGMNITNSGDYGMDYVKGEKFDVTVTVESNNTSEALSNATLDVSANNTTVYENVSVDSNGTAVVSLQNATWNVSASADGYEDATESVGVNGSDANLTLSLVESTDETAPGTGGDGGIDSETIMLAGAVITIVMFVIGLVVAAVRS